MKAVGRGISAAPGLRGFTVELRPQEAAAAAQAAAATGRTPAAAAAFGLGFKGPAVEGELGSMGPTAGGDVGVEGRASEGECDWRFLLIQPTAQHVASACVGAAAGAAAGGAAPLPQLRMWETLPLRWDRELDGSTGERILGCSTPDPLSKL